MSSTEEMPEPATLTDQPPRRKLWRIGTLVYTAGGLSALFFWLLWGDFTLAFKDRSINPTLQKLLQLYHASAFLGAMLQSFLPPLISILLIPVISYKSDRHRGSFGRRIPFLLPPTILAALMMVSLGYSPKMGSAVYRMLHGAFLNENQWILLFIGISWSLFELASLTCGAVFGWLIADVVPHAVLGRFFGMFRALSLIAGMIFGQYIFGYVAEHFEMIFLVIAVLYGVSFSMMCLKVKEGDYPPPDRKPAQRPFASPGTHVPGPFRNLASAVEVYVRDCFSKPYYLWFFVSFALVNVAFAPINLYSLWYATSLGMSDTSYGHLMAIQLGCSLLQAFPLGWLADRFHPIRVTIFAIASYAVLTLLAFFFVHNALTFAVAFVSTGTVAGMWLTVTAPLGPTLLPKSKYASYASALGIINAVGVMIGAPLVGRVMDYLNPGLEVEHYDYHYIYLWASAFMSLRSWRCSWSIGSS